MNVDRRLDLIEAALAHLPEPAAPYAPDITPSVLARTYKKGATYPTAAAVCYAMRRETFDDADEIEGGYFTFTTNTGPDYEFFAFNLGGSVPPQGKVVVCHFVEGHWVFTYNKPAT